MNIHLPIGLLVGVCTVPVKFCEIIRLAGAFTTSSSCKIFLVFVFCITGPPGSRSSYILGFTVNGITREGEGPVSISLCIHLFRTLMFHYLKMRGIGQTCRTRYGVRRSVNPTRHNCQSGVGHALDAHWSVFAVPFIVVSNHIRFDDPRKPSLSKQAEACAERRKDRRITWRAGLYR